MDWHKLVEPCLVRPGSRVRLDHDFDPGHTAHYLKKAHATADLREGIGVLSHYQDAFYAESSQALLVVLQASDAAGKDGTIKHVMSGLNPQGVEVRSFKAPSSKELSHDYLWRHNRDLPEKGRIGIFNRSHYENVLVVRVHPEYLSPPVLTKHLDKLWDRRFGEINDWERYLTDNGITIVKIFLNLSKDEQRKRFLARIDDPDKNWKFSAADLDERARWDDYRHAFEEVVNHTSTTWAPWCVVPADHKWFSRVTVGAILIDTMARLDPKYPTVDDKARAALADAREQLTSEGRVKKR